MSSPKKPRKLPKAESIARTLHQQIGFDRSQAQAIEREKHLRSLMGLPPASPRQETSPDQGSEGADA
jgi:hypothetical protein